jgi:class 3 adenylate cyclase/tetratricopeptide (TPR) repeat protein
VVTCPSCSKENPDGFRFCGFCSTLLQGPTTASAEERKVVTILFCDLVGFTASADAADPEDVRATLRPYHALLREGIEHYGGTVEKFVGDAVMAAFGAPTAHEDDPERAIRSAFRILDAIEELNEERDLELAVRIGVNTGEAVVTLGAKPAEGEGFVTGDVVNVASRLQGVAPVGGIVVGEQTFRATRFSFDYEALEPVVLKGKAEAVPVWRPLAATSRFGSEVDLEPVTPFVGRELERSLLESLFARTVKETSVQLVTITGEPGIGKTRLVGELGNFVEERDELVSWRQGRCLAYGEAVSFWALGEIVKAHAGILESDDAGVAGQRLDLAVEGSISDPADRTWVRARLAPLVGLVGTEERGSADAAESFNAWTRFLEGIAERQPLVIVVEDLHWADDPMLDFLEHLAEWASGVAILIVGTARPELLERRPGWGASIRNATRIALDPLSDEDASRVISGLLERSVLPAETQAMLLERASGNPLYAEQFVRSLRDRGLIDETGRVSADVGSVMDEAFPETVQALIAARLDTLSPDRKGLLQDAAVVGKVFWSGALAAMRGVDATSLHQQLHELARKELIRPSRRSSVAGETEFAFWHALVRDVAYGQIPRAARGVKHQAAAQWIEATAGERVADVAELLVDHYERALEFAAASGEAEGSDALQESLRRVAVLAAERAERLHADRAEEAWERAAAATPPDHPERPHVLLRWGNALREVGRYRDAFEAIDQAANAFAANGNEGSQAVAIARRADTQILLGLSGWKESLTLAMAIIDRIPECAETVEVLTSLAGFHYVRGNSADAVAAGERAIAVARDLHLSDVARVVVRAEGYVGAARCDLGDALGVQVLQDALQRAVELGSREAILLSNNLGYCVQLFDGPLAAIPYLREGIDLGRRRGSYFLPASSLATTLIEVGEWDEAFLLAEEAAAGAEDLEANYDLTEFKACLARILIRRGRIGEASGHVDWLLRYARASGEPQDLCIASATAAPFRCLTGDLNASRELLDELIEAGGRLGQEFEYAARLPEMVRCALAADALQLANDLVAGCSTHAPIFEHAMAGSRALLLEHAGDREGAVEEFGDCVSRWQSFGVVWEEAHAHLGLARCLAALGLPGAREHLLEARAIFERLRAAPSIAETDALIEEIAAAS